MISFQLRLLNFGLRIVEKRYLAGVVHPKDARSRLLFQSKYFFRRAKDVQYEAGELGGIRVLWANPQTDGPVLLYFHGGAYQLGAPETHMHWVGELARRAGVRAVLPDYRLAPEKPFPAAVEDAMASYRALLETTNPADIILGGDSAGGGLALGLLHSIIAEGLPVPAGVVTYSPWTDLTASGASLQFNANADPLLPARRIAEIGAEYLNGADPQTPSASPLFGEFPNAPPVYIHVGSTEVLLDDARRMAERLREFGARVELQIDDQTPHVLPMFFGAAPESTRAIIEGARFIDSLGTAVSTKDN